MMNGRGIDETRVRRHPGRTQNNYASVSVMNAHLNLFFHISWVWVGVNYFFQRQAHAIRILLFLLQV
jgi:hypothetical protein